MHLPLFPQRVSLHIVTALFAASLLSAPVEGYAQEANAIEYGPASVSALSKHLLDAVVNISTTQNMKASQKRVPLPRVPEGSPFEEYFSEFFGDNENNSPGPGASLGSGFIIDADQGIIVTNNHVITGADEIVVNLASGIKCVAELIGVDTKTDLAVLKINYGAKGSDCNSSEGKKLTGVSFGKSEAMEVGDWVLAIGNPFGFGGSVSIGIVSAQNRQIGSGLYDDYIQTDAAINRGNSGGPLFNMKGEVIGINTAIISPSGGSIGIGFAIPSKLAMNVVSQLREFGQMHRGWLGVRIQPVTEQVASSMGLAKAQGALISGVEPGSPADGSDIQAGDIVQMLNGTEIVDIRQFSRLVAESAVGKEIELIVMRNGSTTTVKVVLGQLIETASTPLDEDSEALEEELPVTHNLLGMELSELTDDIRSELSIKEGISGVVVMDVEDGSSAAEQRINIGDVIAEADQLSVTTPQELSEVISEANAQNRRNVYLLVVSPNGDTRFVNVRIH